jgi:hypothetical protein
VASYGYVQSTVHNVKYTTHEQSLETMIEGLFDRATQAEAMLVINRSTDPSLPISMGRNKKPRSDPRSPLQGRSGVRRDHYDAGLRTDALDTYLGMITTLESEFLPDDTPVAAWDS